MGGGRRRGPAVRWRRRGASRGKHPHSEGPKEPPNLLRVWQEIPGQLSLLEGVPIGTWKWVWHERGPTTSSR